MRWLIEYSVVMNTRPTRGHPSRGRFRERSVMMVVAVVVCGRSGGQGCCCVGYLRTKGVDDGLSDDAVDVRHLREDWHST